MNRKGLSILMRTKMRPLSPAAMTNNQMQFIPKEITDNISSSPDATCSNKRNLEQVRESMHSAISMNKTDILDAVLRNFSEGYFCLSVEDRRRLLITLAREYDFDRTHVQELMKQYLGLELPAGDNAQESGHAHGEEWSLSAFYRIERNLRQALKPNYEVLFERLNTHPGGLKFLSIIRADILSLLMEENVPSLRALDSYLKDKLSTWLSPANLELHNVTWDDPASLLEKIVAYEAVHPISNLLDLKRRLGVGRRCFGYLHPAIGEPLIFIEVALMKNVAETIQEVLWDDPPIQESEATCALFYSISSTQMMYMVCFCHTSLSLSLRYFDSPNNLGKFLIKRVIDVVKKDMPHITTFATLSPIPGYMQWLLSKLASSERSGSAFRENLLKPQEEKDLLNASREITSGKDGMEVMLNLLTSTNHEWSNSADLILVLRNLLMRLCARYLLKEKKRGKSLDSVANFHLQNGAMVGKLNWMADRSQKGLGQSGGIMVNYIYRLENIEENAQSYNSHGHIQVSSDVTRYLEGDEVPSK